MSRPFPFFSICIPNFNYAGYISLTIRSVLAQSYPHFEIIVADNASTDGSVEVVRSIADPRVRLIQNPCNLGFAPNLDRATETATGDYLILVSSDDMMKPGALETYARIIEAYEKNGQSPVLAAGIDLIDGRGQITGHKPAISAELRRDVQKTGGKTLAENAENLSFQGRDLLRAVLQGSMTNIGTFVSTCYPRSLYERVGGYRSTMSVIPDAQFSQKLMLQNPTVVFAKENLFQYRIHGQNFYSQIFTHIKLYCDKYLLAQSYSDADLAPLGLTRATLLGNFVRQWCIEKAAWAALQGHALRAFRAWSFGWSASPKNMARHGLAWAMPLLLLFSPLSGLAWLVRTKARAKSPFIVHHLSFFIP